MNDTLLLVEDDRQLATFLADNLTADGFELLVAGSVRDARRILQDRSCNVAIVDVELPDGSGLDLLESREHAPRPRPFGAGVGARPRARAWTAARTTTWSSRSTTPSCCCASARCCGARPAARSRGGACGSGRSSSTCRRAWSACTASRSTLSAKEFALLTALAADPNRVFTKQELLRDVWGWRVDGTTRTLDSHACRLRQKLGVAGDRFVLNVWGVGYRLTDAAVA